MSENQNPAPQDMVEDDEISLLDLAIALANCCWL